MLESLDQELDQDAAERWDEEMAKRLREIWSGPRSRSRRTSGSSPWCARCSLCTPRRGNQKGAVENLVGFAKNSFFKVRRFHDRQDRDRQLFEWLALAHASASPRRRPHSRAQDIDLFASPRSPLGAARILVLVRVR